MRFWSSFKYQIDQTEISEQEKFAYFEELVIAKVRAMIEKLPCSAEGYKRAKDMLIQRFGEESEVVNAHV